MDPDFVAQGFIQAVLNAQVERRPYDPEEAIRLAKTIEYIFRRGERDKANDTRTARR